MKTLSLLATGVAAIVALHGTAAAGLIQTGDVVVQRVGGTNTGGAGSGALSSAAANVYLDVYRNVGGTWSRATTVELPGSGTGTKLTASGSATSEGFINRSMDGQSISVFGYNVAAGTANAKNATDRTLATVSANDGSIATVNGTFGAGGSNARSSLWTGSGFYYTTDGGVGYVATGGSPTSIFAGNTRVLATDGTSLFTSSGTAVTFGTQGIGQIGTGLPTTTATGSQAIVTTGGTSPYAFAMIDTDRNGVADLAYVTDSTAGLSKWQLNGGTWANKGVIAGGLSGLSASFDGTSVTLSATSANGANLFVYTDSDISANLSGSLTSIATAAQYTAFRGTVYMGAVPAPGAMALLGVAGMIASRRRRA